MKGFIFVQYLDENEMGEQLQLDCDELLDKYQMSPVHATSQAGYAWTSEDLLV